MRFTMMRIGPGTRRRLRTYLWVIAISIVFGSAYGALAGHMAAAEPGLGAAIGVIRGFTISAVLAGLEIFVTRTRVGRAVERAPFLLTFAVKTITCAVLIVSIEAVNLGSRIVGSTGGARPFDSPMAPMSLAFSFAGAFLFIFIMHVGRIVGMRTLRAIIFGRYHRPRTEERFFLFVDVVGSTGLAERVGPEAVHRFLDRVFRLASDPIDDQRGEIYQYVGDEMVVTWPVTSGRIDARPLACFFGIEAALAAAAPRFVRDFGVAPRLRAALHAGPVIAGEIGESKRDIVFHGDVMNTASRLEQLTRELGRRFVVSGDALDRLDGVDRYVVDDLGPRALRGRAAAVQVLAVEPKGGPPA